MDHTFPVTVVDHAAAAVAGATVVIVDRSTLPAAAKHPFETVAATHTDQGAGRYQETAKIVPANGNWILIVSLAGKSPVVQPLKWKSDKAGEFTTTPAPAAVATVTITAATFFSCSEPPGGSVMPSCVSIDCRLCTVNGVCVVWSPEPSRPTTSP